MKSTLIVQIQTNSQTFDVTHTSQKLNIIHDI